MSRRGPCWISTANPTSLHAGTISRSHTNSPPQLRNETQVNASKTLTPIENIQVHFGSPPLVPHWHSLCGCGSWCHIGSAAALAPGWRGSCQAAILTFLNRAWDRTWCSTRRVSRFAPPKRATSPPASGGCEPSEIFVHNKRRHAVIPAASSARCVIPHHLKAPRKPLSHLVVASIQNHNRGKSEKKKNGLLVKLG